MNGLIFWLPLDDCHNLIDPTVTHNFHIRYFTGVLDGGFSGFTSLSTCSSSASNIISPEIGEYGSCLYFSDGYIPIGRSYNINITNKVSLYFRLKLPEIPAVQQGILCWSSVGTIDTAPWLGLSAETDGTIKLYVNAGYRITVNSNFSEWMHILIMYNGDTWYFYINGTIEGSYTGGYAGQDPGILGVGRAFNLTGVVGYIDDVRIWDTALSHELANELYFDPYPIELKPTISRVFTYPAILKNLDLDALLQRTGITKTSSLDALLYKIQTKTVSLDTLLQSVKAGIVSFDALIQLVGTRSVGVDALLNAVKSRIVSLDALLIAAGENLLSIDLDALLIAAKTNTVDLDAVLCMLGLAESTSLDALLRAIRTGSIGLDALTSQEKSISISLDTLLRAIKTGSLGLDAVLVLVGQNQISIGIDALLNAVKTDIIDLDALIQMIGQTISISIDTLLSKTGTGEINLDALLQIVDAETAAELDALLESYRSTGVQMDAILGRLFSSITMPTGRMIEISPSSRHILVGA